MLALPSLTKEYILCFSKDPALDLPEIPELSDEATDAEKSARDAVIKEREEKLKPARDSGNWPAITKPNLPANQQPTRFKFRQVHGNLLTWWHGQNARESLTVAESFELMFRLALVDVENLGSFEVKHDDGKPQLVSLACLNKLYALGHDVKGKASLGRELVMELGALVANRAVEGCPPLS